MTGRTNNPDAAQFTYAGVGNLEARLLLDGVEQELMAYRGTVGGSLPRLRAFIFPLAADWFLMLYSDGIKTRVDLKPPRPSGLQAAALLAEGARATDDATVVLAVPRRRRPRT